MTSNSSSNPRPTGASPMLPGQLDYGETMSRPATPASVSPASPAGGKGRRRGGGRKSSKGEQELALPADFQSYYGRPVVKRSPWEPLEIAGYFFLGGLAGGSSLLAAGGDLTGHRDLARVGRLAAAGAIGVSLVALVKDLGRPERFVAMLRVFKPTSPMSVGTWAVSIYAPAAFVAAGAEVLPVLAPLGRLAGLSAAAVAPAVASYTAVLVADTALPAWHGGGRQLPFVFVGSAAASAGGLALAAVSRAQAAPARRLAVMGAVLELVATRQMLRDLGMVAEVYHKDRAGRLHRIATAATATGAVLAALGARRSRLLALAAGVALLTGSACTRFAVFYAGQASADDPRYTVVPQQERIKRRQTGAAASAPS